MDLKSSFRLTARRSLGALHQDGYKGPQCSSKEQALDDEGLSTLMWEVEAIVNSRPITKSIDDPSDCEALTPNHLLLLRSGPCLPPGSFSEGRRTLPEEMATGSVSG